MTNSLSFSKLAGAALIGSIMTGSLLGCQPSTDTAASEEVTAEHEGHDHSEHEGHDHNEHEGHDHDEHDGHDHNEHEGHDHDEHDGHDHEGHNHASAGTPYTCEPTATIGASYHNDDTPHTANLIIDGLDYDLVATSDSNTDANTQAYVGEIGLDYTHGIIWQVNGDTATLRNKTLDNDVAIEEEEVLFNCQKS
ncbi:hypothetical protein [Psychrobacter sp. AOP7-A1-24]|uniref:hypothetical protein n=1 Tax=Psychrobacter sp. AOP7-A1-24 TaxID=3457646 RepID=UPI00402B610A